MSDYLEEVRRFDATAPEWAVAKIVRHLGIALRGRDSSLVSCSDIKELDRVRDRWAMVKLGHRDANRCDAVIERVCEEMRGDRNKKRVTFYYLVVKHLNAFDELETLI